MAHAHVRCRHCPDQSIWDPTTTLPLVRSRRTPSQAQSTRRPRHYLQLCLAMLSTGIPSPIATDGIDDATEALRRSRGHPSTSVQKDKRRGRISHGPRTTPSIKTPAHTADHGKCHESRRCPHASARMHARTHARAQARTHAGGLAENTRSPPNAEAATNARDIDA